MIRLVSAQTENIPSWSFKEFTARKNYACRNCGGMIVIGTRYLRHVERLGSRKGKDPLRNVHVHLDCHAPWYQPGDLPHQLRQVGNLPGRVPPETVYNPSVAYLRPHVAIEGIEVGTLLWKLPEGLAQRIAFCPSPLRQTGAVGELEQVLTLVVMALTGAAGNKRKALKLSHLLNEIVDGLI